MMGRECVNHYSTLHRYCVFSHDELVCKMAVKPDNLDLRIAASTYYDMLTMVDLEKKLRKNLLEAVSFTVVKKLSHCCTLQLHFSLN